MTAQSRNPAILLTRPVEQSVRFAASVQARFADATIIISPLLAPRYLNPMLPTLPWAALIFTSETAVQSAVLLSPKPKLPRLAFCVGDRTAQAATDAGFDALSAAGDITTLTNLIAGQPTTGPLLHLHGRETTGDIADPLALNGIEVYSAVSYAQEPQPLSGPATDLLRATQPVIVPIFSPRSGALFSAECQRIAARAPITLIAISPAAARTCYHETIVIARRPDAVAILDAIATQMPQAAQP